MIERGKYPHYRVAMVDGIEFIFDALQSLAQSIECRIGYGVVACLSLH